MAQNLKIFIVEDDSMCVMLLEIYLNISGYKNIGHASTGEEAVIKVKEMTPDVIFMDIMLAGDTNGIEAAKQIKMNFPDAAIIYTSAYNDPETVLKAGETNPLAFIDKPYRQEDIHTAMLAAEKYLIDNGSPKNQ